MLNINKNINKNIIQHYIETLGLKPGDIYIKGGKIIRRRYKINPQQKVDSDKNNDIYSQAEDTCDKIINSIDKLLNYIKNE